MENGRMTIMFCNIEAGLPYILRLFGIASIVLPDDATPSLKSLFPADLVENPGFRAIYKLQIHRMSSSCGYSLPQMTFQKYRSTLDEYAINLGRQGVSEYRIKKNAFSIDGLPSLSLLSSNDSASSDGSAKPSKIQPYAEDGYIYGRVVDSDDPSFTENAVEIAATQAQQFYESRISNPRKVSGTSYQLLITVAVVSFAIGIASRPILELYMHPLLQLMPP
jgi:hypothetical protein